MSPPTLLPVFLRLEGRKVLVVGGGPVAASRVPSLLAAGADVTVVAPEVRYEIERMAVRVERRPFRPEDVDGAWLVVAAAPPDVNRAAGEAAGARGVFVNAVDDPAAATVYTGAVLRRGGVTIAVSTEGRAPALAGLVREALEAVLPDDVSSWVGLASALRAEQRAVRLPMSRRRPLLLEALNRLYAGECAAAGREPAGAGVERAAVPA